MTKRYRQYPRMTSLTTQYPPDVNPLRGALLFFLAATATFLAGYGLLAMIAALMGICTCR